MRTRSRSCSSARGDRRGRVHESINFAALKRLPVVFVCENNLYSVYSPLSVRQPAARDRAGIARATALQASPRGWQQR